VEALKRYRSALARRDAQQFIATLVTIVVALFGSAGLLGWQNARLVDQMGKRFNERFTAVETRLDRMETQLDRMETRLTQVATRLDQMETRFDEQITALETRLDQVEQNLTARFEDLRQVVLSRQEQP
ncbi:MAG: hypothetical protein ACE5LU_28615, partial [Anaerolineae bacterium]